MNIFGDGKNSTSFHRVSGLQVTPIWDPSSWAIENAVHYMFNDKHSKAGKAKQKKLCLDIPCKENFENPCRQTML